MHGLQVLIEEQVFADLLVELTILLRSFIYSHGLVKLSDLDIGTAPLAVSLREVLNISEPVVGLIGSLNLRISLGLHLRVELRLLL